MSVVKVANAKKTQKHISKQIENLSVSIALFTPEDLENPQAKKIYETMIIQLNVLKEVNSGLLGDFSELMIY